MSPHLLKEEQHTEADSFRPVRHCSSQGFSLLVWHSVTWLVFPNISKDQIAQVHKSQVITFCMVVPYGKSWN